MLKHNLLIILRNIKRNKSSFVINLIGLSTGLACALLIYLWVNDELHVDKFGEKDNQRFQIMNNIETTQGPLTKNITPFPLAEALAEEMQEVEYAVATNAFLFYSKEGILSDGNKSINIKGMLAGEDFFNVFPNRLIQGNRDDVLSLKDGIVISESLAQKLFPSNENIIGKSLKWEHPTFNGTYQVAGVFEDFPQNATVQSDVILSIDLLLDADQYAGRWLNCYVETFVLLKNGTNIDQFNTRLAEFLKSKPSNEGFSLFAQQYSKKYLYGRYENGVPVGSRILYVKLFSIVALFILLIACVNFMNLSTAKASTRMKEIGIKKTIGANQKALVLQYMGEALLMAFMALLMAILLIELFLPQFNAIAGKHLSLNMNIKLLLSIIGITLLTGIISGSYPAFYLSGFNPVSILKGKQNTSKREVFLRKGLVIFQFTLSVIFISCFLTINKQIQFFQDKNLGYNRDHILCFQWKGEIDFLSRENSRFDAFIAELKNIPGVSDASSTGGGILDNIPLQSGLSWRGQESDENYVFRAPFVSYDFIEMLNMEIIDGRSFSKDFGDENTKVILNETAVKMMELENPIGKELASYMQVIGVVKDFHYGSLHESIKPFIFRFHQYNENIMVKIIAGNERNTIEQIKNVYKEFHPAYPFEFTFMDDEYQTLYNSEMRVGTLSKYFAGLAILISCLGLFALSAFTAQRRKKEIGIRKVLGSSEFDIIYLLSSDFTRMVLISIAVGAFVSYFILKSWLGGFAYKIDLQFWTFAGAGLITLIITWFTVGTQAVKAALTNPVNALKYE